MSSQHSSFAPARSSTPSRLRSLTVRPGFRVKLKPRRDALTRVSHDMRSLLHSVLGYADLLVEPRFGALTSEQERFVGHMRTAATRLQELVDTCVELTHPEPDAGATLEAPRVQLGASLRRVRNTLLARALSCDLLLTSELELHELPLDVSVLERALSVMAGVLSREGTVTLALSAAQRGEQLILTLRASDAGEGALVDLEALEDQLGNRDFVRLKLAEVLLSRLGFTTELGPTVDQAELTLSP